MNGSTSKTLNRQKGKRAELIAAKYLQKKGYHIVAENFSTRYGEIDIIAKDREYIVFIEVKYRAHLRFGYPREAVSKHKIKKIHNLASYYEKHIGIGSQQPRFDVIEILGNTIEHIVNAF